MGGLAHGDGSKCWPFEVCAVRTVSSKKLYKNCIHKINILVMQEPACRRFCGSSSASRLLQSIS